MKGVLPLLAICSLGVAWPVVASESCAAIADNTRRLACYDMEYRPATTVSVSSKWDVSESVSRIDDSKSVTLYLTSDDTFPGKYSRGRESATLIVRCLENTTSAYFRFGDHFLADIEGYGRITYRIDDAEARTESFRESTDHKALGLWRGGQAIPFIKRMMEGDAMVVRATPYNESSITTTFTIAGLSDAVVPLREACGW